MPIVVIYLLWWQCGVLHDCSMMVKNSSVTRLKLASAYLHEEGINFLLELEEQLAQGESGIWFPCSSESIWPWGMRTCPASRGEGRARVENKKNRDRALCLFWERGKNVLMLPAAVSCNPWKAGGFLLVNQARPSAPSPTMQLLACKSSLKFWQGMQLKWAAALLKDSAVCCWLTAKSM